MTLKAYLATTIERIWYAPDSFGPIAKWVVVVLTPPLILISWLYRALYVLRWRDGVVAQSFNVPIVVVGNLTVGGSGKTPWTIALAQALHQCGWRVGIVAHGVGARANNRFRLMPTAPADKTRWLALAGDETRLLALHCPFAALIEGRPRLSSLSALLEQAPTLEVVIVDDGLQDARFCRQLECVMTEGELIAQPHHRLIPAGPWREPFSLSSLWRPTRCTRHRRLILRAPHPLIHEPWGKTPPPIYFNPQICALIDWDDFVRAWHTMIHGDPLPELSPMGNPSSFPHFFSGRSAVVLITAIARGDRVMRSLVDIVGKDAPPIHHWALADHAPLNWAMVAEGLRRLVPKQVDPGSRLMVLTEKDAVKLILEPKLASLDDWRIMVLRYGGALNESQTKSIVSLLGAEPHHDHDPDNSYA